MTAETAHLPTTQEQLHRIELEVRIVRRLQRMDYALLQQLDIATQHAEPTLAPAARAWRDEAPASVPMRQSRPTRRQALVRLMAGGTAVAAASYLAFQPRQPAEERQESPPPEMAPLQMLLELYEMMDRAGLDQRIATALMALGLTVEGLKIGATALRSAVDFIGGILDRFEAAVPHVLAGIKAVEDLVQTMERHVKRLGDLLGEVVDGAAPITDALDRFVKELLGYLPFGIGDRIQQVVQEMSDLIALLPAGVQLVSERLISPMRAWFPTDDAADMRALLFTPTRTELLDPARDLLDDLIQFTNRWDTELATPVQEALAHRAEVRTQINQYKQKYNLL